MFDGEYELSGPDVPNIVFYFDEAGIEMRLRYANIEDAEFTSVIGKDQGKYVVKEAKPLA